MVGARRQTCPVVRPTPTSTGHGQTSRPQHLSTLGRRAALARARWRVSAPPAAQVQSRPGAEKLCSAGKCPGIWGHVLRTKWHVLWRPGVSRATGVLSASGLENRTIRAKRAATVRERSGLVNRNARPLAHARGSLRTHNARPSGSMAGGTPTPPETPAPLRTVPRRVPHFDPTEGRAKCAEQRLISIHSTDAQCALLVHRCPIAARIASRSAEDGQACETSRDREGAVRSVNRYTRPLAHARGSSRTHNARPSGSMAAGRPPHQRRPRHRGPGRAGCHILTRPKGGQSVTKNG